MSAPSTVPPSPAVRAPRPGALGPLTEVEREMWARPETRLLLAAARDTPSARDTEGVDWAVFRELVASHRLVPHVAETMGEAPGAPPRFRRSLARAAADNAVRQLSMTAMLTQVLAALGEAGVPALPVKGPALATWLFGDVTRRTSVDLDVLVPPDALADAFAVVDRLGFESGGKVRGLTADEARVVASEFQLKDASFFHPGSRVTLEIHWRPFRDQNLSALTAGLAADLRVDPTGLAWRHAELSPAGAAFVLAHGAMHGYRRLSWLADAAALCDRLDADAWDEVVARAAADGIEGAVLLGPFLARRLLGAPMPGALRPLVEAQQARLGRLAERCLMRTPEHPRQLSVASTALGAGLYDRPRGRARFLWRLLTSPASGELPDADLRPGAVARARRLAARPVHLIRNGARWVTGGR